MLQTQWLGNDPKKSIFLLIALWLLGFLLAGISSSLIIGLNFSPEEIKSTGKGLALIQNLPLNSLRLMQSLSTLLTFVFPVAAFYLLSHTNSNMELRYKHVPHIALIGAIILIIVFAMPLVYTINVINLKLSLPDFLSGLENWMQEKEEDLNGLVMKVLTMQSKLDLLLTLIVVAVIPAVAEELFFRGALQKQLSRLFGDSHMAILVTALIFSFIHLQFYGFFPRVVLGIVFGYMFFWSGSIWYSILAHLFYNGSQVLAAYYMGDEVLNSETGPTDMSPTMLLFSTIFFFLLMAYFKHLSFRLNHTDIDEEQ